MITGKRMSKMVEGRRVRKSEIGRGELRSG